MATRSDGLRVDLLVASTPYKLAGLSFGFDPEILTAPLRAAGLLQGEPRDAQGGRLFELLMPNGSSVVLPLGAYSGTITLAAEDGQLLLGVPLVALPFLQSLRPFVVAEDVVEGGGRVLTLDLPRNRVARFAAFKVDVSLRVPE